LLGGSNARQDGQKKNNAQGHGSKTFRKQHTTQISSFTLAKNFNTSRQHRFHGCRPRGNVRHRLGGAGILIEPIDRASPRQVGRGLVVAFRRRIAVGPMHRVGINVSKILPVRSTTLAPALISCVSLAEPGTTIGLTAQDWLWRLVMVRI
jgi:hypothetical protein